MRLVRILLRTLFRRSSRPVAPHVPRPVDNLILLASRMERLSRTRDRLLAEGRGKDAAELAIALAQLEAHRANAAIACQPTRIERLRNVLKQHQAERRERDAEEVAAAIRDLEKRAKRKQRTP